MRYRLAGNFIDRSGNAVDTGRITVYNANTNTLSTIYSSSAATTAIDGSYVSSTTNGYFYGWVDTDDYAPTSTFDLVFTKTGYDAQTYEDVKVFPHYDNYIDVKRDYLAKGDGVTDDTSAINAAIAAANTAGSGKIYFPPGTYLADIVIDNASGIVHLEGSGVGTILQAYTAGGYAITITGSQGSDWTPRIFRNLVIDGNSQANSGIDMTGASGLAGGNIFENVQIQNCNYGVRKLGAIGNTYYSCVIDNNNYGYYAEGDTANSMHAGADAFNYCRLIRNDEAAYYCDGKNEAGGGVYFNGGTIEGNEGYGIYVKDFIDYYASAFYLNNVWMENNATGTPALGTPKDIYFNNVGNATIENTTFYLNKYEFIDSHVITRNCSFRGASYGTETNSDVMHILPRGDHTNSVHLPGLGFMGACNPDTGRRGISYLSPGKNVLTREYTNESPNGSCAISFTPSQAGLGTNTFVNDGQFGTCLNVVFTASQALGQGVGDWGFTSSTERFYAWSCKIKGQGSSGSIIHSINGAYALTLESLEFLNGQWRTYEGLVYSGTNSGALKTYFYNGSTGTPTVRISSIQTVAFKTALDARAYLASNLYSISSSDITMPSYGVTTFANADATPDVSGQKYFNTDSSSLTITDFNGGVANQEIFVTTQAVAGETVTFDTGVATNLKGGSSDIDTTYGDITHWLTNDGTIWELISLSKNTS